MEQSLFVLDMLRIGQAAPVELISELYANNGVYQVVHSFVSNKSESLTSIAFSVVEYYNKTVGSTLSLIDSSTRSTDSHQ